MGMKNSGRKDRHSKVSTAKGLRDRRVRLSAQTAIRFYDVQDRLGFDRPSKAVDWLMKKAKSAIDKLEELPPYFPMANHSDPDPKLNEPAIETEETESTQFSFQLQRPFFPTNPTQDFGLFLHDLNDSANDRRVSIGSNRVEYEAYQKMVDWNGGRETEHVGLWQPLMGQSSASFSQRGTFQSSLVETESIRVWDDPVDFTKNRKTHPNQK